MPPVRRRPDRFVPLLCLLLLPGAAAASAQWPQFRGLDRDGQAVGAGLLQAWGEGQPRELWRRPIGPGFSSVTVDGARLYTLALEGGEEAVVCLDAASGEIVWRTPLGPTGEAFPEKGPRSSPTVREGTVYAVSSQGDLAALRAADGAVVWRRSLPAPRFGYAVSPLVDGDLVVVEGGAKPEDPGVLALDRTTGEPRWTALEAPAGYSSPVAVEVAGVRQYVFFRRAGAELVALSTAGELLWRHPTQGLAIIVTPLFVPPDRFFVATSDDVFGGLMVRVTRGEDGFHTEEVWSERLMRNHFNTSVVVDGYLYGFDNATLRCLDATTGERLWAHRGLGKGSLVAAGGLLLVLGDDGTLVLVRATPEAYREAGRIQATRGRAWTAPSLADGRLYLRDADEIAAFDLRAAGATPPLPAAVVAAAETAPAPPAPTELTAEEVVRRYLEARGGAERWRELESLRLTGRYAAFSESSEFELIRRRGDLYRLEFQMLGGTAIRARDGEGAWARHPLLKPEAGRVEHDGYIAQQEREALFGPPLVDAPARGIEAELLGEGEVNGRPTIDLRVGFPGGRSETWHLDPATFLEVAVDSEVVDFTQLPEPMEQRAFFADFRAVEGLVMPFRIDLEFGARLETMEVERVEIDPEIDPARFSPPAVEKTPAGDG